MMTMGRMRKIVEDAIAEIGRLREVISVITASDCEQMTRYEEELASAQERIKQIEAVQEQLEAAMDDFTKVQFMTLTALYYECLATEN